MAITFRTGLGQALTHAQMDENFSSLYYSSSLHDSGTKLRLWFNNVDSPDTYDEVSLPTPGDAGTGTIQDDGANRVITANGDSTLQGEGNLLFDGNVLELTGRFEPTDTQGNISIGRDSGLNATEAGNILIGENAGLSIGDTNNVAIGNNSLVDASTVAQTVSIGAAAGENVTQGEGNIYLGNGAGPTQSTIQSNKLYINNSANDTPLILGDFATGQVTFNSQVSASVFSGSFVGNGANLTGVTAEWDGTRDGNAQITGSLIVSGGVGSTVNFTNVGAISGSIFSGSFVGDGSGLTGITSTSEWDGTRDGNAQITGSLIVSGSSPTINLKGITTVHTNIKIHNPVATSIGIGANTLNYTPANSIAIGQSAGAYATSGPSISIGFNAGIRANGHAIHIGYNAGLSNTGQYSVVIGGNALFGAANASETVAIGYRTLQGLYTGIYNTSVGHESTPQLKSGRYNTAIGASTLYNLIEGVNNVALGYQAGSYKVNVGNNNVYIGPYTGRDDVDTENNQLYIDNKQTNEALIRGDFEQRTLTLNALQVIIPNLPTDPSGLPIGALYRDGDFVLVKTS